MLNYNYHTPYLEGIKKSVGASFVAFERTNDNYAIKVIRNKEVNYFDVLGSPDYATPQKYKEIRKIIEDYYGQV